MWKPEYDLEELTENVIEYNSHKKGIYVLAGSNVELRKYLKEKYIDFETFRHTTGYYQWIVVDMKYKEEFFTMVIKGLNEYNVVVLKEVTK